MIQQRPISIAVCSLLILVCIAGHSIARTWSDKSGKYKIEAEFVEIDGQNVKLRKDDGKFIIVSLERLSDDDQEFARNQSAPKGKATDEQKEKAESLIKQAGELLAINPIANAKLAGKKLRDASEANPYSIEPDYMLGLLNALIAHNSVRAERHFAKCLVRDPENVAVMNSLAVSQVKLKRYSSAMKQWERAMELTSGSREITQNLGRLVKISGGQIKVSDNVLERAAELYASAVASGQFPRSDPGIGWLYMPLMEEDEDEADEQEKSELVKIEESANEEQDVPMRIVSGGTGFVVHDGYLLTNRHVVKGAHGLLIKMPNSSKVLNGSVFAVAKKADLAIVKCDDLNAPAMSLSTQAPRRGSEIIVLGFPHFGELGATLKTTRGTITSLPSNATDGMLLVDAVINSGNSGGPIADQSGRIVAIATAVFQLSGGTGGKYGAGLPVSTAIPFLKQHVPDIEIPTGAGAKLEWPDIDEWISRSTVLILAQKRLANTGLTSRATAGKEKEPEFWYHDLGCPRCDAHGVVTRGKRRSRCPLCGGSGIDTSLRRPKK